MGRMLVTAYLPTVFASMGWGAVVPLIAIQATSLGASVQLAAVVTGLSAIGQLIGDLPAGVIADRFGERKALTGAALADAAVMAMVFWSGTLWFLSIAVLVHGLTGSVFSLARQTYLTEAIPLKYRARALSSLGGVFRIGQFLGPLAGAWVISRWSLPAAFLLAAFMSLCAAAVAFYLPDLPSTVARGRREVGERVRTLKVLSANRRAMATIGIGCLLLMLVRTARASIIPLWCDAHGLGPETASLIYSASMTFDVLLFLPGGSIMDRFGRWWITVPSMIVMGIGFMLLPLSSTAWTITAVACVLGLGNGVSSGIVMTVGADLSPTIGRPQFLAGWRLLADLGAASGPLLIGAVTAVATLGISAIVIGGVSWMGAAWMSHWLPRRGPVIRDPGR